MKKILVFQHVPFEILGTLNPLIKQRGFRVRYINFGRDPEATPDVNDYDGLIILGGPMNVDQADQHPYLHTEMACIQAAIAKEIPILGICLGAQLIAHALGAVVKPNKTKEIGWYELKTTREGADDPLLRFIKSGAKIFQWHGYTFDMPQDAIHLAHSENCANQAFRYKDNVYGFQFHLEADEDLIERWLTVPVHQEELAQLKGQIDPEQVRKDTMCYINQSKNLSREVFTAFIDLFGRVKATSVLPSR